MDKNRIAWIDVAKFWGIYAIYLGHFGEKAGQSYLFVFQFHVQLFFFLAGCVERFKLKKYSLKEKIIKEFQTILIPFYFFSMISVVINCILVDHYNNVLDYLLTIIKGNIRNTFFASGLWFLSCLFCVKIIFFILEKIFKNPYIIWGICIILVIIAEKWIHPPRWGYNIDSAMKYAIFYATGYYIFEKLERLFLWNTNKKKICGVCLGGSAIIFAVLLWGKLNLLDFIKVLDSFVIFKSLVTAFIMIFAVVIVSAISKDIPIINKIGRNSMYLCGTEYIVKTIVTISVAMLGIEVDLSNPLQTHIYTFFLLLICYQFLVPIEKRMLGIRG